MAAIFSPPAGRPAPGAAPAGFHVGDDVVPVGGNLVLVEIDAKRRRLNSPGGFFLAEAGKLPKDLPHQGVWPPLTSPSGGCAAPAAVFRGLLAFSGRAAKETVETAFPQERDEGRVENLAVGVLGKVDVAEKLTSRILGPSSQMAISQPGQRNPGSLRRLPYQIGDGRPVGQGKNRPGLARHRMGRIDALSEAGPGDHPQHRAARRVHRSQEVAAGAVAEVVGILPADADLPDGLGDDRPTPGPERYGCAPGNLVAADLGDAGRESAAPAGSNPGRGVVEGGAEGVDGNGAAVPSSRDPPGPGADQGVAAAVKPEREA